MSDVFPDLVVVVPGLIGSVLEKDGKPIWGYSLGATWRIIAGDALELQLKGADDERDDLTDRPSRTSVWPWSTVGNNGIAFEGRTINVGSKGDENFLVTQSGGSFRDGLNLLTTVQPALKPFVGLASSLVGAVLKRSNDKQIHNFNLGLDFSESQTSVALRHGSFAIIQADDHEWDWSKFAWSVSSQRIVEKDTGAAIPLNFSS